MTIVEKFISDIEKTKKYARQNKPGFSGYESIKKDIQSLFERSTSCPTDLPHSLFEYWENAYIYTASDLSWEPEAANCERLAAMLALMEDSDEYFDTLSNKDWQEIGQLVNYEADDLPVDILQSMMSVLVSKGAY